VVEVEAEAVEEVEVEDVAEVADVDVEEVEEEVDSEVDGPQPPSSVDLYHPARSTNWKISTDSPFQSRNIK